MDGTLICLLGEFPFLRHAVSRSRHALVCLGKALQEACVFPVCYGSRFLVVHRGMVFVIGQGSEDDLNVGKVCAYVLGYMHL